MCVVTLTKQKEAFTLCYFLVSIIKAATIVVQPPLECVEKASDLLKDGCRALPPWVRGSKTASRRTKTGLGRLKEVSWWLKNTSKPLSETTKIGFSLDTSIENRCFNNRLLNHTCVTSCRCLKVLQSVLKASRYPPGRLSRASWSLHESTKMGVSCDTSFKNRFLNNMLPKHRLVTSSWCLEAL